jgi:hypothetical protein
LRARDEDGEEEHDDEYALGRTTQQLLMRLRKQVPSKPLSTPKPGARPSLGEDIFA